jgi:hypothetical protein
MGEMIPNLTPEGLVSAGSAILQPGWGRLVTSLFRLTWKIPNLTREFYAVTDQEVGAPPPESSVR